MPVHPPAALGRGVVLLPGAEPPPPWRDAPVVRVDDAAVADPAGVVQQLHDAWRARTPVVVELAADPRSFRDPADHPGEPWTHGPAFEPWLDRLQFLVWRNTYDARTGTPVWWWARKAERLGAPATAGTPGDVQLPDGSPAWIDGGPRLQLHEVDGVAVVHAESVESGLVVPEPEPVAPRAPLAPDQLAAVAHGAGPACIVAPAGSGKTRVLTERLRHLLGDRGYRPERVLAVAYNKKAQEEMAERTQGLGARIQTLNAWGYHLVARWLGRRPPVLDEREVRRILERLVPRSARRVNTDPIARYIEALSLVRLGLRDPATVERQFGDVPGLAAAYGPYRAELRRQGALDFDEQVYLAVEALLTDGAFRQAVQAEHAHLLVDELQDLTPAHVLMVRLVSAPGYDVFGVGDDDQTIYSHAGADPGFLVDYDRWFPGAHRHALEVNYRCPAAVTRAAAGMLANNGRRIPKAIRPGPEADPSHDALRVQRHGPDRGAAALVDVVAGWLDEGTAPAQVAVLARVQSLLLAPQVALGAAGVPVSSILDATVLGRLGVRAALAYLRLATGDGGVDPADLVEIRRRPSRGLPNWADKWLGRCRSVADLRRAAARIDDDRVGRRFAEMADDVGGLVDAASRGATTRELLVRVRDQVGLGSAMSQLDASGGAAASHGDDLEGLLQVSDLHPDPGGFEPWLRSVLRRERDATGVTLSTVHRVKGREWDRVAVFGVTEGILPHRLATDVEEERRVLHVAVTRARHQATVLVDEARPSSFVDELAAVAAADPPA